MTASVNAASGLLEVTGININGLTQAQIKTEYPDYLPGAVGVFRGRTAYVRVEGHGVLRALDGQVYTLPDLPEPDNTRE